MRQRSLRVLNEPTTKECFGLEAATPSKTYWRDNNLGQEKRTKLIFRLGYVVPSSRLKLHTINPNTINVHWQ